jgi:tetratricopeptide (TPR) repeat protein
MGHALAGLSIAYSNEGELQEGEQLARQVLEIAERADDDSLRLLARIQLAVPTCYSGRFEEALEHCDEAARIYDSDRHGWIAFRFGTDHGVAAHGLASLSLCLLGYTDRGLARARECIALAHRLGLPFNVAYALTAAAVAHWLRGDLAAQEETGKQIEAIASEQAFDFWTGIGRIFHWGARAITSRNPSAIPELIDGTMIAARTGTKGAVPALLSLMAEAHMAVGDVGSAAGTVEGALSLSAATGQTAWDPRLLSLKGTLALAFRDRPERDRLAEAESCYRKAIDVASGQSARLEELRAATMLGELMCRQERRAEAAALLQAAYARLPEQSAIADVQRASRLLAELADAPDAHGTTAIR